MYLVNPEINSIIHHTIQKDSAISFSLKSLSFDDSTNSIPNYCHSTWWFTWIIDRSLGQVKLGCSAIWDWILNHQSNAGGSKFVMEMRFFFPLALTVQQIWVAQFRFQVGRRMILARLVFGNSSTIPTWTEPLSWKTSINFSSEVQNKPISRLGSQLISQSAVRGAFLSNEAIRARRSQRKKKKPSSWHLFNPFTFLTVSCSLCHFRTWGRIACLVGPFSTSAAGSGFHLFRRGICASGVGWATNHKRRA